MIATRASWLERIGVLTSTEVGVATKIPRAPYTYGTTLLDPGADPGLTVEGCYNIGVHCDRAHFCCYFLTHRFCEIVLLIVIYDPVLITQTAHITGVFLGAANSLRKKTKVQRQATALVRESAGHVRTENCSARKASEGANAAPAKIYNSTPGIIHGTSFRITANFRQIGR